MVEKSLESTRVGGFNDELIQKLKIMLGTFEKPTDSPIGSCSLPLLGTPLCMNVSYCVTSWVIDSRATDHMTPTSQFFHSYNPCPSNRKIVIANEFVAAGVRDIYISLTIILKDVLHVPKYWPILFLLRNLLMISIATLRSFLPIFFKQGCYFVAPSPFRTLIIPYSKLMFLQLFQGLGVSKFHCDVCELAKHPRIPFPSNNKRMMFRDLLFFHSMVQTQFGAKIKKFRTDNARDYFNQMSTYFTLQGIIHDSSCVNTTQQNRVAERKNGHLLNTTKAFIISRRRAQILLGSCAYYLIYDKPIINTDS
ncbi:hypothetical protein CR513_33540, partial [Mucuna pruriens]